MPAFMSPAGAAGGSSQKRKLDSTAHLPQSKRHLAGTGTTSSRTSEAPSGGSSNDSHWMVQWRNPQMKKHKTWDGDGILVVSGNQCLLFDTDNHRISQGKPLGLEGTHQIVVGATFSIGGKDVEVDCPVSKSDYKTGTCFSGGNSAPTPSSTIRNSSFATKAFIPLRPKALNAAFKPPSSLKPHSSREPLGNTAPETTHTDASDALLEKGKDSYWTANWRKPQNKKHRTWDGDAFVIHKGEHLTLVSEKGTILGTRKWDGIALSSGYKSFIGGKELELDSQISQSEMPKITGRSEEHINDMEFGSPPCTQTPSSFLVQNRRLSTPVAGKQENKSPEKGTAVSSKSFYAHSKPKPKTGPLHDPAAEGAIVMTTPTEEHAIKHKKTHLPRVPVVLDPILARQLRPHQVEGVKFMYDCVMGLRHEGKGCILADEMGMGKTLQTITLVWTLLKQNPYGNSGPVVGKVLIVCPVTLINNWKNEFHKWLGRDRVGVFVGDKDKATIKQFINSRIHHVLIIGYERLRTVIEELAYCVPPIGLIICDEGHRLKSANNKTSTMFEALRTPRRIILSGTPIQNDLGEFHAMADFCNPGMLEDSSKFRKVYEAPILKSRAPGCSTKEKEIGEGRSQKLMEIAKTFVLRRDATILKSYLPPKYEYVVFITPTKLQRAMFQKILTRDNIDNLSRTSTAESLALINLLTKISNSPILLKATADQAKKNGQGVNTIKKNSIEEALKLLPEHARVEDVSLSGKLAALANLLRAVYKDTDEKFVIVSHYTSTLNIIEAFCKKKSYTYHRLDGQTPTQKRQEFVNDFNRSSQSQRFVFLLSSKAGGVGLNLIGASRLCLIDSDWNPSHDLQSMARIHRDGQKRPVFIYRFLTSGTIDEKIFQRQVTKLGLSNSLIGDGKSDSKSDSFSRKDLRDIFTIHPNTACHTHDLLECPCSGTSDKPIAQDVGDDGAEDEEETQMGFVNASEVGPQHIEKMDKAYLKQKKAQLAALGEWTHINCLKPNARDKFHDTILKRLLFVRESEKTKPTGSTSQSRLESLLAATDLEKMMEATAPALSVHDVPGGTVSFLFERGMKTKAEEEDEVEVEVEDDDE